LVITASQRSTSWGSSCLDMALRDPNQSWHKSGTLMGGVRSRQLPTRRRT
jgi:hypothetical protein